MSIIIYSIIQLYICICAYFKNIKLYFLLIPTLLLIPISYTYENVLNSIIHLVSLNYKSNSRLYCYNLIFIIIPCIFEYINMKYKFIKYFNILLFPFVYGIYNLYIKDINKEKLIIEENSIKNNINIIINE